MEQLSGKLKRYFYFALIFLFNCFPIKKNKIIMFSYYGSQYGCNPKYISEYITEKTPNEQFDIVWAFNRTADKENIPSIRKVKIMSLKYFFELCTSKIIITNFRTTDLFVKRKDQYYIQTWHSSLRLKQIEKDAEEALPGHYVKMAKKDSEKCDLLLSGCEFSTNIFKRAFWYEGEIFKSGTPRNDLFFSNDSFLKEKIFVKLNIPADSNIVLYAPTFRKDSGLSVYNIDYSKILKSLKQNYGGEWTFLVKLHPHLSSKSKELNFDDFVIDVTNYNDIQELLSISDILISDYSSLMFDFSITQRPCFLYVPDYENYVKQDRNLYFNLLELPFKAAMNNEELIDIINTFDNVEYEKDLSTFNKKIGSYEEGRASELLVQRIHEVCFSQSRGNLNEAV
ncbi:CDP-glycerol glycerophosphotransferase family protein [Cytobacillus firmus]|uniref:CDP-glycerol glycerophosphotransferase family protein n=1 Tax=Cytobacillus firmus TaxID=1399 RepID=UPI002494D0E5|nr:CDP-glycerol glycerophosphotransferase family protein [Cytobacillus firmus]